MGVICHNYKKQYWQPLEEGILECNGQVGVVVKIGEYNDYPTNGIITVVMNKKVYEKILHNEYYYKSQPYAEIPIKVYDKNSQEIDLLNDCRLANHTIDNT